MSDESLWRKTLSEVAKGDSEAPSTWPILTFLGLLFATPYLVHKLWNKAKKDAIDGIKNVFLLSKFDFLFLEICLKECNLQTGIFKFIFKIIFAKCNFLFYIWIFQSVIFKGIFKGIFKTFGIN